MPPSLCAVVGVFFCWAVSFLSQIREDADVKHTSPPLANAGLFLSLVLLGTRGSPPGLIVAAVFEPGSEPLHIQAVYTHKPRSPTTPRRLCFIFFFSHSLSPSSLPAFYFHKHESEPSLQLLSARCDITAFSRAEAPLRWNTMSQGRSLVVARTPSYHRAEMYINSM